MKKLLKWFIILIPLFAVLTFAIVVSLIPNKEAKKEKIKLIEFTTKDDKVVFLADEKFKKDEKGEYDLYLNKNNLQILGVFTYDLNEYEEKSAKEVLDKQTNAFLSSRKNTELFKKEQTINTDDKTIIKVEYSGKTEKSSDCVYIFSVISFNNNPNYVLYIDEVIIKNKYEDNISEMIDILKSARLK